MAKEKKQLRELSDEDLKNVTGGYIQYVDYTNYLETHGGNGDSNNSGTPTILPDPMTGECPSGLVVSTDENGQPICAPAEA